MRVLSVIDSLGPGGAERSLLEMVPGLEKRGTTVEVALLKKVEPNLDTTADDLGVEVRLIPGQRRLARIWHLRRLLRDRDYDLVHTTLFEADIISRFAAWRTDIPVVSSIVNTRYDPVRFSDPKVSRSRLRVAQAIDGFTARHMTKHFHAITQTVKNATTTSLRVSPDRITVIPRGRDPRRLGRPSEGRRRETRFRLGIADRTTVLLNVGRQEFQKGQQYLIDAMAEIREAVPDCTLLIAGREGSASDALIELLQRHALEQCVRFLGHRDDVPDLLAAADLFVFPSLYEGLGGAILEAMALEVPVVASRLPAIVEVLGSGGVTVPAADSRALADAILVALADEPAARRRAQAARARFEDRFALAKVIEATDGLYRRVADSRTC